jgi:hypothetical protein
VVPVVTRELLEDDTLAGYRIPAGTMITCQLQVCVRARAARGGAGRPAAEPTRPLAPVRLRLPPPGRPSLSPPPPPPSTPPAAPVQCVHNQWRDPVEFRPERFMPGGEYDEFDESVRPYMFLPFIQGPRNCLGQHLALLEARIVLALLTKRFKFTPLDVNAGKRHPTVIPVASISGMPVYVE